jgi:hypothetical protein
MVSWKLWTRAAVVVGCIVLLSTVRPASNATQDKGGAPAPQSAEPKATDEQLIDRLVAIRRKKAELEHEEQAVIGQLQERFKKLHERLTQLGVMAPAEPAHALPPAPQAYPPANVNPPGLVPSGPGVPPPAGPGGPFPLPTNPGGAP